MPTGGHTAAEPSEARSWDMLEVTPGNMDKSFPEAREVWETMEVPCSHNWCREGAHGRVFSVTTPADTAEQTWALIVKLSSVPKTPEGTGSIWVMHIKTICLSINIDQNLHSHY